MNCISRIFLTLARMLELLSVAFYVAAVSFLNRKSVEAISSKYKRIEVGFSPSDHSSESQWIRSKKVGSVVCVDANKIIWGFGFPLSEWNPLVLEAKYGGFLPFFFERFCPLNNTESWYPKVGSQRFKKSDLSGLVPDVPLTLFHWLNARGVLPRNDIAGSGLGRGSQFKGPASAFTLKKEQLRIRYLKQKKTR